jgi:hypothetical protein
MRTSRFAALLALTALTAQTDMFTFKSGAKFEGEVVEVKGTNSVIVRSAKDAKLYTITISMLTNEEQRRLATLQSQIAGAFGIRLGQTFRVANAVKTDERSGMKFLASCPFAPIAPLPNFTEYSVRVTPRSNRVCSVSAGAYFGEDDIKAWAERQKIVAALEEKYGKAIHTDASSVRYTPETDTITKNNCLVEVRSVSSKPPLLAPDGSVIADGRPACIFIEYRDVSLQNEAEKQLRGPVPGL